MFQIQVTYHAAINTVVYASEDAASAAYQKIAESLREYRLFKNDRIDVVEVETDDGKCTFRLERMDAVTIGKVDIVGPLDQIQLEREKMLRAKRLEMGLPELPRGRSVTNDDVSSTKVSE